MNTQNARTGAHECLLQSCWCKLASWYMPDGLWTLTAVCPVPSGEVASKTSLGQRFDQDMKPAPSFLNMELTSQCLIHKESGGSMYVKTEVTSIFIKWIIYYVFLTEKKKKSHWPKTTKTPPSYVSSTRARRPDLARERREPGLYQTARNSLLPVGRSAWTAWNSADACLLSRCLSGLGNVPSLRSKTQV